MEGGGGVKIRCERGAQKGGMQYHFILQFLT